jgi:signal transduction histidine kinase
MDSTTHPVAGQQARPAPEPWGGTFTPPVPPPAGAPAPKRRRADFPQLFFHPTSRAAWRSAGRQGTYTVLGLALAIPAFVLVVTALSTGFSLSLSAAGMLIGLPLLAAVPLVSRRLGEANRRLAARLMGWRIPPPPPLDAQPGALGRLRALLADGSGWRACAYVLLKLPLSVLGVFLGLNVVLYGIPYLTFPIWWALGHAHGVVIDVPGWLRWWTANPLLVYGEIHSFAVTFALIPGGLAALAWAPWAVKGCNTLDQRMMTRLLGPPLGNRLRELERSRASAVDDSAARLRRIERDLHDGAQAQMVAVAMKLGLAREKLGGGTVASTGASAVADTGTAPAAAAGVTEADLNRALELVDAAHRSAKEAIIELRDLARGIHPPALDHGLDAALTTLAARSEVPVEVIVDLAAGRPSPAIETIAYFCAAELLTNVAKHSSARHAGLEVVHVPGLVRVKVTDDGSGGARVEARGGLAGLAERVRTVDGRLEVTSPRGGPTVIVVELPSHA